MIKSFLMLPLTTLFILTMGACSSTPNYPALDPLTDQIQTSVAWQTAVGEPTSLDWQSNVDGEGLYTTNQQGEVLRLDPQTGERLWSVALSESLVAPAWDKSLVITSSQSGKITALDSQTGETRWQQTVEGEYLARPVITAHHVFIRNTSNAIHALDRSTGKHLWSYLRKGDTLSLYAPQGLAYDEQYLYTGFPGGKLAKLVQDKGTLTWESSITLPKGTLDIERLSDISRLPIIHQDSVCAATFQGKIGCFDKNKGNTLWTQSFSTTNGITGNGQVLLAVDERDGLTAYQQQDGKKLWNQDNFTQRVSSNPAIWQNMALIGDHTGLLHFFDLSTGERLASIAQAGIPIALSVTQDKSLFVLTQNGQLIRLQWLGKTSPTTGKPS